MKKRRLFIFAIISALLIFLFFNNLGSKDTDKISLPELEDRKREDLSAREYVEDFEFVYKILDQYYPFFDINKKIQNIDWLNKKEEYINYIEKSSDDYDFALRLNNILYDLHNGHTYIVDQNEAVENYVAYYRAPKSDWRHDISKIYEKERVRYRYRLTNKKVNDYLKYQTYDHISLNNNTNLKGSGPRKESSYNIDIEDINDDISYIKIKEMISLEESKNDQKLIKDYLKKSKDKNALIIDIRGNTGGDSRYWQDFLLPEIIDKEYSTSYYHFIKGGKLHQKIISQEKYQDGVDNFLADSNFNDETRQILSQFDFYKHFPLSIRPSETSINFKGNIYLLVDSYVYSSSEMLASFCNETGLATLVGSETGGDGIGTDPMQIDLPNSGYVLRYSKQMGVTESGKINELEKTKPDIFIDSNTQDDLLDQAIIHKIVELES